MASIFPFASALFRRAAPSRSLRFARPKFLLPASNDNADLNSERALTAIGQRLLVLLLLQQKAKLHQSAATEHTSDILKNEMDSKIRHLTSKLAMAIPNTDKGTQIKAFAKRYAKSHGIYLASAKELANKH